MQLHDLPPIVPEQIDAFHNRVGGAQPSGPMDMRFGRVGAYV
jgi:hypothetical protein